MVGAKTLKLILTFMPRASGNTSSDTSGAIGDKVMSVVTTVALVVPMVMPLMPVFLQLMLMVVWDIKHSLSGAPKSYFTEIGSGLTRKY
jgi:hypothetical protein